MNDNYKLIVAEDNPRDRDFLQNVLKDYELVITTNGKEALEVAIDITEPWLISDIQMPDMNGIELAEVLWQKIPSARILFWSQYNDEMYIRKLSQVIPPETVYGYILKDNSADILQKATHTVFLECQCWIDPKVRPVQARVHKSESSLSDAEFEVLIDIALGLTDNAIARRHYLSRRGVQNRLKSVYAKLGVDQEAYVNEPVTETLNLRARAVSLALRRGLINQTELEQEEEKLQSWLHKNF